MNIRLYVKSFQKILVEENPIIGIMDELRKSLYDYFFLPSKSKEISKNIFEAKNQLIKTKTIIILNSKEHYPNSINLIR